MDEWDRKKAEISRHFLALRLQAQLVTISEPNLKDLKEVLCENDQCVASAVLNAAPSSIIEKTTSAMYHLIREAQEPCDTCPYVLMTCRAIDEEIKQNKAIETLFRGSVLASKMMSTLAKEECTKFLTGLLSPLFQFLVDAHYKYHITSDQGEHTDAMIEVSQHHTMALTRVFLKSLKNSMQFLPITLRYLGFYLHEAMQKVYPEQSFIAVGGFFFLRFICPAILMPSAYGLNANAFPMDANMKRGLILVSKTVQCMANRTRFGEKEPHMVFMNSLIDECQDDVEAVITAFSQPLTWEEPTSCPLQPASKVEAQALLGLIKADPEMTIKAIHGGPLDQLPPAASLNALLKEQTRSALLECEVHRLGAEIAQMSWLS
eukprot:TRINITY_DN16704_c0_g1_i1.p1 TRINITY_DN16704_c0_g1~~TRINITY_DN16704_c0_g1_i1.p1  ORF type:complete len:376 (-),score=61.45 TRINITY_DN16704_c0_g1_i1:106-1233(-)